MNTAPQMETRAMRPYPSGSGPDPTQANREERRAQHGSLESLPSSEQEPPPVRNRSSPAHMPRMPICHSSRQVVPSQPEPSRMPSARQKTPTLARRVSSPSMSISPTRNSMMVNATMNHQSSDGCVTRYSMTGLIPSALGRKWLNLTPMYPGSSGISLFSSTRRRQNAEKYVQPTTRRRGRAITAAQR